MRIANSDIAIASKQISIQESTHFERLHQWDSENDLLVESSDNKKSVVTIESLQQDSFEAQMNPLNATEDVELSPTDKLKELMGEIITDFRARIMKAVIEQLTGEEIKVFNSKDITESGATPDTKIDEPATSQAAQTQALQGWGIDYSLKQSSYSKEGYSFSASGSVTNTKGESINFTASLEFSQERYEELSLSYKAGDALIDPLIVNFTGSGVQFTDTRFEFDLTSSGSMEEIFAPQEGSGFLAYDRNGNGVIDDGSELFGPSTGNGFNELAALDDDKNGWIDENDSAFSSLRIWEKNSDSTDQISTLLQKNVGALYTGKASTLFDLTAGNRLGGSVAAHLKETGLFLKESGGTGFLQEVDLVA